MRPTALVPQGSVTCVRLSHPAKALSFNCSSPRSKLTLTSWRQPKTRLADFANAAAHDELLQRAAGKNAFGAIAATRLPQISVGISMRCGAVCARPNGQRAVPLLAEHELSSSFQLWKSNVSPLSRAYCAAGASSAP